MYITHWGNSVINIHLFTHRFWRGLDKSCMGNKTRGQVWCKSDITSSELDVSKWQYMYVVTE